MSCTSRMLACVIDTVSTKSPFVGNCKVSCLGICQILWIIQLFLARLLSMCSVNLIGRFDHSDLIVTIEMVISAFGLVALKGDPLFIY